MDQKIKNFDRKIEQMMNENAVAPPFGMWNRISAELNAETLPIAAAAPASLVPKRAIIGFVAGALILGSSLLTAYLIKNNSVQQEEIVNSALPEVIVPQEKNIETVVVMDEVKPVLVPMTKTKKLAVSKPIEKETIKEDLPMASGYRNINEIAVPDRVVAQNASAVVDPYYFPPVDVNNPETAKAKTIVKPIGEDDDQEDVADKKNKVSSSSGHEKKLRPKKKRSRDWSFGRINRYKDPK